MFIWEFYTQREVIDSYTKHHRCRAASQSAAPHTMIPNPLFPVRVKIPVGHHLDGDVVYSDFIVQLLRSNETP